MAMAVNGAGVARLAGLAKQHDALLVDFSTDYVFDGLGHPPWREKIAPLNTYGQSKLAGEQAIIVSGCRYLIIRISWLHSPCRTNFLKTMLQPRDRDDLLVVNDQVGVRAGADEPLSCGGFQGSQLVRICLLSLIRSYFRSVLE
ncbi:SDR family oxidoreductase [Aeromonas veronii]|uniref:SDR family oxidoreductase n=1 Tax=Aeromonas veronii TaxID=654 RepID=UPI0038F4260C